LSALLSYDKVGIPFGASEEIDRFLKITDRFIPEYWPTPPFPETAADVARKLHDLDGMGVILVPKNVSLVDNFLTIPVNSDLTLQGNLDPAVQRKAAIHVLSIINMSPVWLPKPRNTPFYPEVRIMAEIAKHYLKVGEFRYYLIASKRSNSFNPPVKVEQ